MYTGEVLEGTHQFWVLVYHSVLYVQVGSLDRGMKSDFLRKLATKNNMCQTSLKILKTLTHKLLKIRLGTHLPCPIEYHW